MMRVGGKYFIYSDNNSCLRKKVWEQLPLPCVPYGKDQLWANIIINNGFKKIYSKDAIVKHSHDYNNLETYSRAMTEAYFFSSCFGYDYYNSEYQMYKAISQDVGSALELSRRLNCSLAETNKRFSNIIAKHRGFKDASMPA